MNSSLDEIKNEDEKMPISNYSVLHDPTFHKIIPENIKTIEHVAIIISSLQLYFQEGHPFYKILKENNLL